VVFSLGELDPDTTEDQFLVADTSNSTSLINEGEGFRMVIPKDKHGARSDPCSRRSKSSSSGSDEL
jgi:hypothetical protein